ncbi:MAG TPA: hypothetical protein VGP82_09045 [Ktedonobacterales bacterium]|jgi:hypothetical protein|nr:hypothetical protein [Ktedonobacterales bacterium]
MFDKEGFDVNRGGPPIQANTPIFDVNGERIGTVAQEGVQGDHLVMAKGLIFVHEVDIPLEDIGHAGPDGVYLKVSKEQLERQNQGHGP